ncbi:MAG: hypothetical protein ACE5HO_16190 [bacterium]
MPLDQGIRISDKPKSDEYAQPENDTAYEVGMYFDVIEIVRDAQRNKGKDQKGMPVAYQQSSNRRTS